MLDSEAVSDIQFTLEVEEGYALRDVNSNSLSLDENNQYITNVDFSSGKQHVFKVIDQDGNISIYTIRVEMGSKKTSPFQKIIEAGMIPSDLANYDDMSKEIFSHYTARAKVVPRYVVTNSNSDGSSWDNAASDIKAVMDGINDADADKNKIYVIMVASGIYKLSVSYSMKNHVASGGRFYCYEL